MSGYLFGYRLPENLVATQKNNVARYVSNDIYTSEAHIKIYPNISKYIQIIYLLLALIISDTAMIEVADT